MRLRQWEIWGVLALLLATTKQQTTDENNNITTLTDTSEQLTEPTRTTTESSKAAQLDNTPYNNNKQDLTSETRTSTTENGESATVNQLLKNKNVYDDHIHTSTLLSTNNTSNPMVTKAVFTQFNESQADTQFKVDNESAFITTTQPSDFDQEALLNRELKPEHRLSFEVGVDDPQGEGDDFGFPAARDVREAADYGFRKMDELIRMREPELFRMGLWLDRDGPAGKVASFNAPNSQALRLAKYGYASLLASEKLLETQRSTVSNNNAEERASPKHRLRLPASGEAREALRNSALQASCPVLRAPLACRPASRRYRTADGTCNSHELPRRGASLTPQQRFMPPSYQDGLQSIRRSVVDNLPLPSARAVSTRIHRSRHVEAPSVTLMLMQWGQFIDHDVISTPQSRGFNGTSPRCCADGGRAFQPPEFMHPECLPIQVPSDDWFFDRFGLKCLEFIRSAPAPREDCDFGHRQQMNQVTSYIDASTIYGSSPEQADIIRTFRGGRIHHADLGEGVDDRCRSGAVSVRCLRPGDGRASEQPALTALHTTWVRQHNALANTLARLNTHWSDEKIYQEARRIVGAMVQHITYREFLPIILGHEVMKLFGLELIRKGYYTNYDTRVNPAPSNAFSAAAYRFGHSLVQDSFMRSDRFHRPLFSNVSIHNEQSNVDNIWSPGSVDRLMLGMVNQPSQKRDEFLSEELTNHLFQSPGMPFGVDLAAINIQRGRDHGLPSYTAWRVPCGLSPISNWTDLQRVMSPETAERFRSLYLSVDDIDLYSAGLAERPVRGGLVGPTFACIIAQQFLNLRKGDRFWYENSDFESSFTSAQLQQIRKVNFAQIICGTMSEVETIQPFVFLSPDNFRNQREMCRKLIDFDLTPWIEKRLDQTDETPEFIDNDVESKSDSFDDPNDITNRTFGLDDSTNDTFQLNLDDIDSLLTSTTNHTDNTNHTRTRRQSNETDTLDNLTELGYNLTDDTSTDLPILARDSDDTTTDELNLDISDLTDLQRDERKQKPKPNRPTRRKTKPKPKPTGTKPTATIITSPRPKANKTKSDFKQISYFGTNKFTVNGVNGGSKPAGFYQPQGQYNPYYDYSGFGRPPSSSNPQNDELIILPTKRPDHKMTYLFNTVRKTSSTTTTTPKPEYQFHIQINYFYNSTTEPTKLTEHNQRPTFDYNKPGNNFDFNKPPAQGFDYNKPGNNFDFNKPPAQGFDYYKPENNFDFNKPPAQGFDYNKPSSQGFDFNRKPTKRPTTYNAFNRPTTYNAYDQNPTYNGQNFNDKIDFGYTDNRFTTVRPNVATSKPITVIELPRPQETNRPNIYIVDSNGNYDDNNYGGYRPTNDFPSRPNFDYNPYDRPQTYDQRPSYQNKPETVVYKRPVTATITKINTKPLVVLDNPNQPNYYGTNYDNQYDFPPDRRPTFYNRPASSYDGIHDKLDFSNGQKYVKVSSVKKNVFSTPRPFDNDKKFIRISTVKGHTTSTNSLRPVYVSTMQKKDLDDDDLEMAYDDLIEVYVKPDEGFVNEDDAASKHRTDNETTDTNTDGTDSTDNTPIPKQNDNEPCSTELPRPINIFTEDDLLDF